MTCSLSLEWDIMGSSLHAGCEASVLWLVQDILSHLLTPLCVGV